MSTLNYPCRHSVTRYCGICEINKDKNMNKEKLQTIKEDIEWHLSIAEKILEGDRDNYDGADGARYIRDLCHHCKALIKEVENEQ